MQADIKASLEHVKLDYKEASLEAIEELDVIRKDLGHQEAEANEALDKLQNSTEEIWEDTKNSVKKTTEDVKTGLKA